MVGNRAELKKSGDIKCLSLISLFVLILSVLAEKEISALVRSLSSVLTLPSKLSNLPLTVETIRCLILKPISE
jgi:hypothetical protein